MRHKYLVSALVLPGFFAAMVYADPLVGTSPRTTTFGSERAGFISEFNVAGIPSVDGLSSPNNFVTFIDIGPGNILTGIGWDVTLQTLAPGSRFSHMDVLITHTGGGFGSGLFLTPGAENDDSGGPASFSSNGDVLKLFDFGIDEIWAGPDGLIRLEFLESVDDGANLTDGLWASGTIFIQTFVPPPGSASLLIAFAPILAIRRRAHDE